MILQTKFREIAIALTTVVTALIVSPGAPTAHPHVWVTVKSEIQYNEAGKIIGTRQSWKFDEFYSSFATQGLDKNGDGKFGKDELAELAQLNVESLHEFDYFTFPKLGDQVLKITDPKDYWLEHHSDGTLTLHFTLPLEKPVEATKPKFSFAVYDPTFYISFEFDKKDPVRMAKGAPENCSVALTAPEKQQQQTAALSEAFISDAENALGIAVSLSQDAIVTCK